jgi:acyl-CoA thioester hydrolase
VELEFAIHWGEMDAYRHVNNIVYFRWFESARMSYFLTIGWPEIEARCGIGPILHSTSARFLLQLTFPDRVKVRAGVGAVEADRFVMRYEVSSVLRGRLACYGEGVIVAYDYRVGQKTKLPEVLRKRIAELEENPGFFE